MNAALPPTMQEGRIRSFFSKSGGLYAGSFNIGISRTHHSFVLAKIIAPTAWVQSVMPSLHTAFDNNHLRHATSKLWFCHRATIPPVIASTCTPSGTYWLNLILQKRISKPCERISPHPNAKQPFDTQKSSSSSNPEVIAKLQVTPGTVWRPLDGGHLL